ncbi:PAS and helix-turn-helix domain-containing protein [Erwinia sp. ErVv1]|uniref:helix-turn-helix transcriptional regulator n=1 Tax=Erwinia sp. ErVv1 TaxID=1603299 RepID=UPI000830EA5C|nr:PAS and helix-turn-helix domain-containing protein [Erwinia sp. ErVv1]
MASSSDGNNVLSAFICMMENLAEPWGIKDLQSRHLYMNKAACRYTNTPPTFNVEGELDQDFPALWAECAEDLQEHDRRTEESLERVSVIETHYWNGLDYLTPYISEKFPFFNRDAQCIGTVWNARPLDNLTPAKFINKKKPSVLTTQCNHPDFTDAEMDIIFLILQRMTAKEMANIYSLSVKTVENRIYSIYQKAGVHSLRQFEEFCENTHLGNYIPGRLIQKGIHFI